MSTYTAKITCGDYGGNFREGNWVKIQDDKLYWSSNKIDFNHHKQLELKHDNGEILTWHVKDDSDKVEILVTLRKEQHNLLITCIERTLGESMQATWGAEEGG